MRVSERAVPPRLAHPTLLVPILAADLPRAPKGKMPYIEHGSHRFGDSALIIRYLEATFFASDGRREGIVVRGAACRMERDRDADTASATWKHPKSGAVYSAGADAALAPALVPVSHLPPQDRAVGHAVMRLVEESLNQKLTAARWVEGANWHIVYNRFLGGIPEPLRCLIAPVIRRGVWADLWAKGQVRHSPADALSMTSDDLDAVESLLQAGKARWELGAAEEKHPTAYFLFGTAPCAYDAALFGMLDNFLNDGMDKPEAALVAPPALPHVHEFVKGIRSLYFSKDT